MQIAEFNKFKGMNLPFLFSDTWLIITKIWFKFVYNETPVWLIDEIRKTKIDLFLVCDIDLPWIDDPVRENGGETRQILHNSYTKNIFDFGFRYRIVRGFDEIRFQNALKFVDALNK